ncbi:TIGR00269 family protein [Candidatus Woesearchaeota archaeon]|nr:TIGR00269 family protein [Candidatus Woesearchaeota archaeon]MCF7900642.1 TIGR00269 family protein [Candidatus Woesearchaeota archaeon]MCF8013482.1 TIGR00269 family protein [Candidatus Woesearchaeota archaeon]
MNCDKCKENAIYQDPNLCKKHFIEYFEQKTINTIKKFGMIKNKQEKICVAASGGKDSVALLFVLHKKGFNVEALAIDEGIKGYRDRSLEFLQEFCKKHKINLKIKSYKKEIGKTIDQLSKKYSPACNVCGTFRRYLLDQHSKEYKKIATGHNLDDEAQAVMMNILKAQTSLFARQGPMTKDIDGFTQKIKPFYFIKEKEIMTYAFLLGLNIDFEECPYAPLSFRSYVRDWINKEEKENQGTKLNIVTHYLKLREDMQDNIQKIETKENKFSKVVKDALQPIKKCHECGSPCSGLICKACKLKEEINA